ncbi:hypothetical protein HPP92_018838 [Vanilla planifolia]|uniref:Tryptophan synthase beta chain-like PALP domain-containing protein n=1 Tax=Vanilla planifolia TaxID=51239 RepID=A0A835UMS4_VANPL|nr:hypothetical protein HPP92_018838 [Vanilla planifolia]
MDSVLLPRPSSAYLRPFPPRPAVGSLRQGTTGSFFRRRRAIPPLASVAVASPKIAEESASRTVSSSPTVPLKRVSPESLHYASGYLGGISDKTLVGTGYFGANVLPTKTDYLTDILSSRVYDVAIESPLQFAPKLSHRLGVDLSLKREDLQPMFSFKLRGAYNMMAKLPKELLERGVICSSAGNHAPGVALAARKLGCEAVIVMPVTTPEIKAKR